MEQLTNSIDRNFETVIRFLEEDEWGFDIRQERKAIKTGYYGENVSFNIFVEARETDIVCLAMSPINVPADKRKEVAEFITRVNSGLQYGTFLMDFSDGELCFRNVAITDDIEPSVEMVRRCVLVSCFTIDKFHESIMRIIYSNSSPEGEYNKIIGFEGNE